MNLHNLPCSMCVPSVTRCRRRHAGRGRQSGRRLGGKQRTSSQCRRAALQDRPNLIRSFMRLSDACHALPAAPESRAHLLHPYPYPRPRLQPLRKQAARRLQLRARFFPPATPNPSPFCPLLHSHSHLLLHLRALESAHLQQLSRPRTPRQPPHRATRPPYDEGCT